MIRFACPRCQSAYEVPDAAAGKKSNCRKCGQRLQVPGVPPLNRTVLGKPLTPSPGVPIRPLTSPARSRLVTGKRLLLVMIAMIAAASLPLLAFYLSPKNKGESPRDRSAKHSGKDGGALEEEAEEERPQEQPKDAVPTQKSKTPGQPTSPKGGELDRLVKQLRAKETRSAAARAIGKMGREARPATRAICEAIVAANGKGDEDLVEALEKVHPMLHKHLTTLAVDWDVYNHRDALEAIRRLGADGAGAVPVLLEYGKCMAEERPYRKQRDRHRGAYQSSLASCIATLAATDPTDPEVIAFVALLVTYNEYSQGVRVRAVAGLLAAGMRDAKLRKKVVPALIEGVSARMTLIRGMESVDVQTVTAAIVALGKFGPDAKEALPALKKEKLSTHQQIREAAADAVAKIEKDDKDEK